MLVGYHFNEIRCVKTAGETYFCFSGEQIVMCWQFKRKFCIKKEKKMSDCMGENM